MQKSTRLGCHQLAPQPNVVLQTCHAPRRDGNDARVEHNFATHASRKLDAATHHTVVAPEGGLDFAAGVWCHATRSLQRAELRGNAHMTKAGCGGANPDQRCVVVEERVCPPCVTVGARRLWLLDSGFEALLGQVEPELHASKEQIDGPRGAVGLKQVVAEVDGGACQVGVVAERVRHGAEVCGLCHSTQNRQALGVLAHQIVTRKLTVVATSGIPQVRVEGVTELESGRMPVVGTGRFADHALEIGHELKGVDDVPVDGRTRQAIGSQWHATVPTDHPVDKVPASRRVEEPVWAFFGQKRVEYVAHAGHQSSHGGRLIAPHGKVVHHANPPQ